MRMLMNNLDPAVAERPEDLIVYGGGGKAARNWECYEAIIATLKRLRDDETLLVQSGKPVGVFRTHDEAPRVLIANAHLVPRCLAPATVDDEVLGSLGDCGIEVVHEHPHRGFLVPAEAGDARTRGGMDGRCANGHSEGLRIWRSSDLTI